MPRGANTTSLVWMPNSSTSTTNWRLLSSTPQSREPSGLVVAPALLQQLVSPASHCKKLPKDLEPAFFAASLFGRHHWLVFVHCKKVGNMGGKGEWRDANKPRILGPHCPSAQEASSRYTATALCKRLSRYTFRATAELNPPRKNNTHQHAHTTARSA